MKPLSVEMASLLGIQNEIQAVCKDIFKANNYIILRLTANSVTDLSRELNFHNGY